MDTCQFSMKAAASGPDLRLCVSLDNQILFDNVVQDTAEISGTFNDDDGSNHILSVTLSEKLQDHTVLDSTGEIIADRLISLSDIMIDDVDITKIFQFQAKYTHDFNGTKPLVTQGFHGSMGCNGTVTLEFKGPVYFWLLENM